MLASGLIADGMNWWQAIVTIFIANVIVLIPMMLNAHAGTLYGIPFPVYCRASFGTLGANVPAVLRALVACGWFGIQTWIGGEAIYKICLTISHQEPAVATNWLGVTGGQFLCFLLFWGINMWVIYRGIDTIRFLLNIKAPLLIVLGLLFLWWAYDAAGGWGPMLSQPSAFDAGQPKAGKFWTHFFPALTGMIGFWATLSLNIPDFSRYAKSPAGPDARRGHRPADDDGALCVHRRGGDFRNDHHFWQNDLGPGGRTHAFQEPGIAGRGDAGVVHGDAGDEHRRERRHAQRQHDHYQQYRVLEKPHRVPDRFK